MNKTGDKLTEYHYRAELLNRLMQLPYEAKLELTKTVIRHALTHAKKACVSISGGKDSTVLLHIVRSVKYIPAIHINTGVEYPETETYIKQIPDVTVIKPPLTFFEVVKKYGLPRTSRCNTTPQCCIKLKHLPIKQYLTNFKPFSCLLFVGLIGSEGRHRRFNFIRRGFIYAHKEWQCYKATPLIHWTSEDIWRYIEEHEIPLNPAYYKYQLDRIGCIVCTGYKDWEKVMSVAHPKLYKQIKKLQQYKNSHQATQQNTKK